MRRGYKRIFLAAAIGVLSTPMAAFGTEGGSCPDMTDSRVFLVESDKDDEGLLIKRTLEWAKAQMCDERWPFGVKISQVKVCYDLNTGQRLVGEADKLTIVGSDGKVRSYPELTPQQVLNIGAQYQLGCLGLHALTPWTGNPSSRRIAWGPPRHVTPMCDIE